MIASCYDNSGDVIVHNYANILAQPCKFTNVTNICFFSQRKEEKELALYGRVLSSEDPNASGLEPDNTDNDHEEDELEIKASVSGKL